MTFDFEVAGYAVGSLVVLMVAGYFTRWAGKLYSGKLKPWLFMAWAGLIVCLAVGLPNPRGGDRIDGPRMAARNDLATIMVALKAYQYEYGALPEGDNAQITTALQGKNPKGIAFIDLPAHSINAQNEFVDRWRHPYRIDTSNATSPRAYSFGPDGKDDGGRAGSDDITSW